MLVCVGFGGREPGRGGSVLYLASGRLPARLCRVQPARSEFSLGKGPPCYLPIGHGD